MPHSLSQRAALLCAALATAAALITSGIVASSASANHAWGSYHWARTANPFTVKVGDNVTGDWDVHRITANQDWDASSVMNISSADGTSNKRCSMTVGTVQVCNGRYGNNGWLGLATINLTSGSHITQGSAKLNDTYFGSPTYNNPNEKLHVMCQEVGHTFGLGHTSEDGSSQNTCMDYFSNTGANAASTQSTHPNQHDYDQLATIYSHLDASTTLAATPVTSPGMAGRSDARPYRSRRTDHGNHTEIVDDFADGSRRITDIIWADSPRLSVDAG